MNNFATIKKKTKQLKARGNCIKKKFRNTISLMCAKLINSYASKICNSRSNYKLFFTKDYMQDKNNLKNTLIICNHPLTFPEVCWAGYLMIYIYDIKVSFVARTDSFGGQIFRRLFNKENIIGVGNSTEKIIDCIKSGQSVLIFIANPSKNKRRTGIKRIIEQTGCKPVIMAFDYDIKYKYTGINYLDLLRDYGKDFEPNTYSVRTLLKNYKLYQHIFKKNYNYNAFKFFITRSLNSYIDISDPYDSYESLVKDYHKLYILNITQLRNPHWEDFPFECTVDLIKHFGSKKN